MTFALIPGLPVPVARIVLGTASLGAPFDGGFSRRSRLCRFAFLDFVLACGGNAFDTARIYALGASEHLLGQWMAASGCRDRVVLITKGGHPGLLTSRSRLGGRAIRRDLERSLRALGTDRVDLYLLHRDDPRVPVSLVMEALHSLRESGKILSYGVSNWTHGRIEEANRFARSQGIPSLAASSPQFSLADWRRPPWPGCISISGAPGAGARAWYRGSGMAVLAWSSLAAGFFTASAAEARSGGRRLYDTAASLAGLERARRMGREKGVTPAQVALAYLLSQPFTVFPVVSTHHPERFRENAQASALCLTPAEISWLETGQEA